MSQADEQKSPYQDLAEHLDTSALGAPQIPELMAILKAMFTPEEAGLAARIPFKPAPVSRLAGELDMDAETLGPKLAAMAQKGLLYERLVPAGAYYASMPIVPGMMELQFMSGETSAQKAELARLFDAYYQPGLGRAMIRTKTPYSRVIPVGRSIDNHQEILPYEKAEEVIRSQEKLALAHCYCRHEAELLGKSCGAPKDVCLMFGPFAEFAAAKGFAQTIDQAKALQVLAKAEDAGLVHVTDNVAEGANFMCNCCGCCCLFLKTITQLDRPGAIAQAAFLASVDDDSCALCGDCVDLCQVGAISMDGDQPPVVDAGLCLGCGQCANRCPSKAISMDRREAPAPPGDWRVLVTSLIKERGNEKIGV